MILRRFIEHISKQNWFAVGLDVLVVITGIFLGLQASEWNENRKSRQLETEYLNRLHEDFSHNLDQAKRLSKLHASVSDELNEIGKILLRDDFGAAHINQLNEIPFRYYIYPSANFRMGTYEELVSTGKLSLIQSSKVKAAIQQTVVEYNRTHGQLAYFRTLVAQSDIDLRGHETYSLDESGNAKIDIDFKNARSDKNFLRALFAESRRHFLFSRYHQFESELTEESLGLLSCRLKMAECEEL